MIFQWNHYIRKSVADTIPIRIFPKPDPNNKSAQYFDASGVPCLEADCIYIVQPETFPAPSDFMMIRAAHDPRVSMQVPVDSYSTSFVDTSFAQPQRDTCKVSLSRPDRKVENASVASKAEEVPMSKNLSKPKEETAAHKQSNKTEGSSVPPSQESSSCNGTVIQEKSVGNSIQSPQSPLTYYAPDEDIEDAFTINRGLDGFFAQPPGAGRARRATNFTIDLKEVCKTEHNGKVISQMIHFDIVFANRPAVSMSINYGNFKSILSEVQKKVPEAIIYPKCPPGFDANLLVMLREELSICPHRTIITDSGWGKTESGMHFYAEDYGTPVDSSLTYDTGFSFLRNPFKTTVREMISAGWALLDLTRGSIHASILFLFAHLGLLWNLFKEAGYEPHTVLFLEGPSGSLKTAVASLVFNFTGQPSNNIPSTFKDTAASQEIKFSKFRDRVFLIDDFCPPSDASSRRAMEKTLEHIVRLFGDGIGRSRASSSMKEVKELHPNGLAVVTGEDSSGSESSMLRCLFLRVEADTFDKVHLKLLQDAPYVWTEYLAYFVHSMEPSAPAVIRYIQERFPVHRATGEQYLKKNRLIDAYAWLATTADIIVRHLKEFIGDPKAVTDMFYQHSLAACQASEYKAKDVNPAQIFAKELLKLKQRGQFPLGSAKEFEYSPSSYIGAEHNGFWFLWPEETYNLIRNAYMATGKIFPKTMNALWGDLAATGILIRPNSKKPEYRSKASFGKRPYMLKIDPNRLVEIAERE